MAVGFIDIDQIPEGPNRAAMYPTFVDDASLLENVKLWMGQAGEEAYFMGIGVQGTDDDGDDIFEFNFDTRQGQLLLPDGTLEEAYPKKEGADEIDISSISESDGVVTVNTQTDHGYSVGSYIQISGAADYNGNWRVGSVPSADTLKFPFSGSPADEAAGTVVQVTPRPSYTRLKPGVRYDASVTYTSTAIAESRAIGARAKVTVNTSLAIQ